MYDACIHDRFEQCSHDCPDCPWADQNEPDPDDVYEEMRDRT